MDVWSNILVYDVQAQRLTIRDSASTQCIKYFSFFFSFFASDENAPLLTAFFTFILQTFTILVLLSLLMTCETFYVRWLFNWINDPNFYHYEKWFNFENHSWKPVRKQSRKTTSNFSQNSLVLWANAEIEAKSNINMRIINWIHLNFKLLKLVQQVNVEGS